jgi:hypothetical protein
VPVGAGAIANTIKQSEYEPRRSGQSEQH